MSDRSKEVECEWPNAGEIDYITWDSADGMLGVGIGGITRIEPVVKSGEMSFIPYVRVWKGDEIFSEHCQHKLTGVFFKVKP